MPGKPDESELVARITRPTPNELMPPPKSHKKLTRRAEGDCSSRWIAAGRRVPAALVVHRRRCGPTLPAGARTRPGSATRSTGSSWRGSKPTGLQPAPEADRRTLARRLSLDLTGLPPEPAEVEAFVNDTSPDAYEKLRRPAARRRPHWGEHRGRYWLDAARYADTHGIHFDNFREMWAYRDWVIDAFNRNMPFDQFTIEQLAGDLLPNRTLDQQIASGFNRCNMTTNEGGAIAEEYLVLYTRDRTETISQVWLGLTAGCAVCHDHKFDPLTQKEFYELAAFFNNTTQDAMDGNIKDTPPIVVVPPTEDRPTLGRAARRVGRGASRRSTRAGRPPAAEFDAWLAAAATELTLEARRRQRAGVARAARTRARATSWRCRVGGKSQHADARRRAGLGRRRHRGQGVQERSPETNVAAARRRRLREGPAVLAAAPGSSCRKDGIDRRGRGPHGRRQRLSRLGPVARQRPARRRTSSTTGPTTR